MIKRGGFGLKTERSLRPRVSTLIVLKDEINRQMPGAIKTADGNTWSGASK